MNTDIVRIEDTDWERCPYCGSDRISAERPEMDGTAGWSNVNCLACGRGWLEVYEASHREKFDDEDPFPWPPPGKNPCPVGIRLQHAERRWRVRSTTEGVMIDYELRHDFDVGEFPKACSDCHGKGYV